MSSDTSVPRPHHLMFSRKAKCNSISREEPDRPILPTTSSKGSSPCTKPDSSRRWYIVQILICPLTLGAEAGLDLISQHVISKGRFVLFPFPNVRADFDRQLTRSTICISGEQNIQRISTTQKQDVLSFLRWEVLRQAHGRSVANSIEEVHDIDMNWPKCCQENCSRVAMWNGWRGLNADCYIHRDKDSWCPQSCSEGKHLESRKKLFGGRKKWFYWTVTGEADTQLTLVVECVVPLSAASNRILTLKPFHKERHRNAQRHFGTRKN